MQEITNNQLIELLSSRSPDTSWLNKLKIAYRPYICPFNELLQQIPPKSSVFDMGCGSGMFLMLVAEYCSPEKLAGVEISEVLVENAKKLLLDYQKPLELAVFDGKNIPEWIKNYDCITMIDVLHHIPEKQQELFLTQLYDKMQPNARFVFKDIDAQAVPWLYFNKLHDLVFAQEIGNEWKASRFIEFAQKLGFKVLHSKKQRTYVYPHYTIILQK